MKKKSILEFAKIISGIFSNKEQALNNPKRYAHIEIHTRPLLLQTFKCYAFYSEQRFNYDNWNPYRQSINKLSFEKNIFVISNYKIDNQERYTGGGLDISLFENISKENIHKKLGCSMYFRENEPGNYIGNIEPGQKCLIKKGLKLTYVSSEVKINKNNLISEDSGYDNETGDKLWGSDYGPLVFKKYKNFNEFIDNNWG
tara:strand:+ start:4937 stop:5536 length:600 start_codon:yes stop_codon:yes gene_type:complete